MIRNVAGIKIEGVILIGDGEPDLQGDAILIDGVQLPKDGVMLPVTMDFSTKLDDHVGVATIKKVDKTVVCEGFIFGKLDCLVPFLRLEKIFGAPSGKIFHRIGHEIHGMSIESIGLVAHHADLRVPPLKIIDLEKENIPKEEG